MAYAGVHQCKHAAMIRIRANIPAASDDMPTKQQSGFMPGVTIGLIQRDNIEVTTSHCYDAYSVSK